MYRAACSQLNQVPIKTVCRYKEGARELRIRHCNMDIDGAKALAIALLVRIYVACLALYMNV